MWGHGGVQRDARVGASPIGIDSVEKVCSRKETSSGRVYGAIRSTRTVHACSRFQGEVELCRVDFLALIQTIGQVHGFGHGTYCELALFGRLATADEAINNCLWMCVRERKGTSKR